MIPREGNDLTEWDQILGSDAQLSPGSFPSRQEYAQCSVVPHWLLLTTLLLLCASVEVQIPVTYLLQYHFFSKLPFPPRLVFFLTL